MRAVEQPDREVREQAAVDHVDRPALAMQHDRREEERIAHAHPHRLDEREAVLVERLARLVGVVGQVVRDDDHAAGRDVGADHVKPVLRPLVLRVADVGDVLSGRQVTTPDVGKRELCFPSSFASGELASCSVIHSTK